MDDILFLRDIGWFLRNLSWGALYLLFIARLRPRKLTRWRLAAACAICIALPMVFRYFVYIQVLWDVLLNIASCTALCLIIKQTDWRTAFYGAVAFAMLCELNLIISHDVIVYLILMPRIPGLSQELWNLIHTALYLAFGVSLVLGYRSPVLGRDKSKFGWGQMIMVLLPFAVYVYARNLQFSIKYMGDNAYQLKLCSLLLLIGLSDLVAAILADSLISERIEREELRRMENVIQKQKETYAAQVAASDALRQQYHDLKNRLIGLRSGQNTMAADKLAGDLETILDPIGDAFNTGNDYLDVILSEKSAVCREKEISLVPYVNGQDFDFLDGLDLCVILGNALDNAIEAVEALPPDRRAIHVKACTLHGMALLVVQNYYSTPPQKDSRGFYRTVKSDTENHGYGLRGISHAVERYNGTVDISVDAERFTLSMLIPFPGQSHSQNEV